MPFKLPRYVAFIALIFCFPTLVLAQVQLHYFEHPEMTVRLMDAPCVDATSVMMIARGMPANTHARFKHIDSNWKMKDGSRQDFVGCWARVPKEESGAEVDAYLLIFSDGNVFMVPTSEFDKVKGGAGV
jgi:hypothetical protein